MPMSSLRVCVISADAQFRSAVLEVLRLNSRLATVLIDLPMPVCRLDAASLAQVRSNELDVILADLAEDALGAMKTLPELVEGTSQRAVIATGPLPDPALLLEGMKAGIAEYLPAPVDARALADALLRAGRRLGRGSARTGHAKGRVISFIGAKGGAGVTTTVMNAGVQLQRERRGRNLLIDFNLENGDLAVAMGLKPRYSILDLIENLHRMDESLLSSLVIPHDCGLHVLAAPVLPQPAGAEMAEQMRAALRILRHHYDHILIDVAHPYSDIGRVALEHSDVVCLLVVPDILALHGAKRVLPLIQNASGETRIEIILSRADSGDAIQRSDVVDTLEKEVKYVLHHDPTVISSLNIGKPATLNGARSVYIKDIRAICTAVAVTPKKTPTPGGKIPGFLRALRPRRTR